MADADLWAFLFCCSPSYFEECPWKREEKAIYNFETGLFGPANVHG